jgi:hypothetical protein
MWLLPFSEVLSMLLPDRSPDHIRNNPAVADEILRANVIRVERIGSTLAGLPLWLARIGPDEGLGATACSTSPEAAVRTLMERLEEVTWPWDETWKDRPSNG